MANESGFERREEGFEAKVQFDGEHRFRLEMKRDKLFAVWAAGQLGMDDSQAEAYQAELCKADLKEPGDDDVIARVMVDFTGKGVDVTEDAARAKLAECWKSVVDAEG